MIYIISIGGISVFFGLLLLVAPNTILSIERRANKIYMTETQHLCNIEFHLV